MPDTYALALDTVPSAKDAVIFRMLGYLDLAKQLSQRGTIPRSVLSSNTDLLRAFAHLLFFMNRDNKKYPVSYLQDMRSVTG